MPKNTFCLSPFTLRLHRRRGAVYPERSRRAQSERGNPARCGRPPFVLSVARAKSKREYPSYHMNHNLVEFFNRTRTLASHCCRHGGPRPRARSTLDATLRASPAQLGILLHSSSAGHSVGGRDGRSTRGYFVASRGATTVAATALVSAAGWTIAGLWFLLYWTDGLAYIGMRPGLVEYLLRILI